MLLQHLLLHGFDETRMASAENQKDAHPGQPTLYGKTDRNPSTFKNGIRTSSTIVRRDAGNFRRDVENVRRYAENVRREAGNVRRDAENVRREAGNIRRDAENVRRDSGNFRRDTGSYRRDAGLSSATIVENNGGASSSRRRINVTNQAGVNDDERQTAPTRIFPVISAPVIMTEFGYDRRGRLQHVYRYPPRTRLLFRAFGRAFDVELEREDRVFSSAASLSVFNERDLDEDRLDEAQSDRIGEKRIGLLESADYRVGLWPTIESAFGRLQSC